jgi:hypothetical protein
VKHLFNFTPAETLIVRSGEKTPLSDLLKYTLMDLLLKQVLSIEEVQRRPSPRDPVRTYKYVATGKNFVKYQFRPHEVVFLSMFRKDTSIRLLFRNLVKVAYQGAKSTRLFHPMITTNVNLKTSFYQTILQRIFGGFKHSAAGTILRKELEAEISQMEIHFPEIIKNNRDRGLEMLRSIGGNIFLMKGIDFALASEIDKELFEEMSLRRTSGGCSSGCWTGFDNYSDNFDSSCSSDIGSGCGGDSGCSGGSGCSGCGGCGGD